jgi:hypothetical protein
VTTDETKTARLRVMLADYEFLVTSARGDVERFGAQSCDYGSMMRTLKHDIENLLGRPIYDEPSLLPEHGPEPDGVPF